MPSIATGANAANRELTYIGISGDGDSLSIGIGQLVPRHPPQRRHGLRHREQRRLRADQGPVLGVGRRRLEEQARRGEPLARRSIRCCWRSTSGATFVARSFSGDKAQLVPILKAALSHRGLRADRRDLAVRDLQRSRGVDQELPAHAQAPAQGDRRPTSCRRRRRSPPTYEEGTAITVTLHDGSTCACASCRPTTIRPTARASTELPRAPPQARRDRDRPAVRREAGERHARHQRHDRRPRSARFRTRSSAPARRSSTSCSPPSVKMGTREGAETLQRAPAGKARLRPTPSADRNCRHIRRRRGRSMTVGAGGGDAGD